MARERSRPPTNIPNATPTATTIRIPKSKSNENTSINRIYLYSLDHNWYLFSHCQANESNIYVIKCGLLWGTKWKLWLHFIHYLKVNELVIGTYHKEIDLLHFLSLQRTKNNVILLLYLWNSTYSINMP